MRRLIRRIINAPVVAHILAAVDRYTTRLGPQFAAATTYYTVLTMVPILMFGFSMLGMTLTVFRPDLLIQVRETVVSTFGTDDDGLGAALAEVIENALGSWRGVALTALLTAAYAGSRWVGNLKRAVRVMWSDRISDAAPPANILLDIGFNLVVFLGVLVSLFVGVGVAQVGNAFSRQVVEFLGWQDIPGIGFLWGALTVGLTFLVSWLLFAFLFTVLPTKRVRFRVWLIGTLVGAVSVTIVQSLAGRLVGLFSGNDGIEVFGPVIVVMLLFNILATLILLTAAWVGTDSVWLASRAEALASRDAVLPSGINAVIDPEDEAAARRASRRWAATKSLDDLRGTDQVVVPNEHDIVRQDAATRAVSAGLGIGYVVGAATGLGLGAAVVGLAARLRRRR